MFPLTLRESLDALELDDSFKNIFPVELIQQYLDNINYELNFAKNLDFNELFERYSQIY